MTTFLKLSDDENIPSYHWEDSTSNVVRGKYLNLILGKKKKMEN